MRCLLSSVVACVLLAGPARGVAQDADPATTNYEKTGQSNPPAVKKTPRLKWQPQARVVVSPESAARLIHERAMSQARMRRARIEARHWAGVSLLRPTIVDDRPYFGSDWGVRAGSPWWWSTASARVRLHW